MKIYMAPMEGITRYVYRKAFAHYFGGVDRYFIPFLTGTGLNAREIKEISPENNAGMDTVPQILTNRADIFVELASRLKDYGYSEVNLNLGCPSGTVTAKGRGAGFLKHPDELECFLDEITEKSPLPVSVKTRIGFDSEEEWPRLLELLMKFPFSEMIIHPRLRQDFYRGKVRTESYRLAVERAGAASLCYNGDIRSVRDYRNLVERFPDTECVMLGRGLIANPGLAGELKGQSLSDRSRLKEFLAEILEGYRRDIPEEKNVLAKLLEIWTYLSGSFPEGEKLLKRIRRAKSLTEYRAIVEEALEI